MKKNLFVIIFVLLFFSVAAADNKTKSTQQPDSLEGMVFIKGGCFDMGDTFGDGSSDEKPVHDVCVGDFYIGRYEVTQGEWKKNKGNNPSEFKECGENCPVENVSLNDIQEYIKKINQKTEKKFRLPTEAEWEYAARSGGKKEKWAGTSSDADLGEFAWYGENSNTKTHPAGEKKPNGLGLYDMSGNVWEWVSDLYDKDYYKNSPKDNPKGADGGGDMVLRGGSWYATAMTMRAAYRLMNEQPEGDGLTGFRLVQEAK